MAIYTYVPSEVQLVVSGYVIPDITNISVDWTTDKFMVKKGIRGSHTRVKSLDTSCVLTVAVSQTSVTNDVFSEIVRLDGAEEGGQQLLANLTILLKDNSGKSSFASDSCFISNYASLSFNDSLQDRMWTIHCLSTYDVVVGSNQKPLSGIFG